MPEGAGTGGEALSRRDFLRLPSLWGRQMAERLQSAEAPAVEIAAPALPHDRRTLVDVGSVESVRSLAPGAVQAPREAQGRFFLVRVSDGLLAVARVCSEPGCAVLWQERSPAAATDQERGWANGRFFCLQHRRTYDRYGIPAESGPGALDVYLVSREGDRVVVDPASPLPRSAPNAAERRGVLTLAAS
ncbi:MAG: hypothetical protein NTZ05_06315 [Chloroflexi bacterium]|nr:hypothetical protein [Chloroflexota bacterium]